MSLQSKSSKKVDKQMEENIAQFCGVTNASVKDARKFLDKYKRLEIAVDAYFNGPPAAATPTSSSAPSTAKLNTLFDQYKDPDEADTIKVDGTLRWCEDLGIEADDVVTLALALELGSKELGTWAKKNWVDGWKRLGADSLEGMKPVLRTLSNKLASDADYFHRVYNQAFELAKAEGQRSLTIDSAQAFWEMLLPFGLRGGALSHVSSAVDGEDVDMDSTEEGFQEKHVKWWFDFLNQRGKGVTKDTWQMLYEFIRSIDSKFTKYDMEAAWPSTIDDFVEYAKTRAAQ